MNDTLEQLWTWTPYLLGGFGWNVFIALVATVIGNAVAVLLVALRLSPSQRLQKLGEVLANGFYKVPTLALMFYCAILLPTEVTWPGSAQPTAFPAWIKAALALSAAQVGFTAHNLGPSIQRWRQGSHSAALLFIPQWGTNLLITIIASSAASLVGVSELVSRCNTVINASADASLMVPLYLYASLFFLVLCYPLVQLMHLLRRRLQKMAAK